MSFDWKSLVKNVAPTLATALGGPFAGMAVKTIAGSLLSDDTITDESKISAALAGATQEQLIELQKADQNFKLRMEELGIDLEKIAQEDRASARKMQTNTKSIIVPILAGITVACFFGVVFWVLTGEVSIESTLLGFVLGQVSSKAEQVYNFYFGSSAGSKEKTAKLIPFSKH